MTARMHRLGYSSLLSLLLSSEEGKPQCKQAAVSGRPHRANFWSVQTAQRRSRRDKYPAAARRQYPAMRRPLKQSCAGATACQQTGCKLHGNNLAVKYALVAKLEDVSATTCAGQREISLLLRRRKRRQLRTSNLALGCLPSTCSCSFARLEVHTKVDRHMLHCATTHAVSSAANALGALLTPLAPQQQRAAN